jgi:hypothetical protein
VLDILIPIHKKNLEIAELCIEAIDKHTPGVPTHLILAIDGATKSEFGKLEAFMRARGTPIEPSYVGRPGAHQLSQPPPAPPPNWELIDWPGSVYFQRTIIRGLERMRAPRREGFVAIIPPWIEIRDPTWFAKMQMPFAKEAPCMAVTVPRPGDPQSTLPPAKFMRRKWPGTEMLLTRPIIANELAPLMSSVDSAAKWVDEFSRIAEERGGTRWEATSVRYYVIDHHDHSCPQPESSETPEPISESPSPTTPASSSPTTTEADGLGVSAPF